MKKRNGFGEFLRVSRSESGLGIRALSKRVGVSRTYLQRLEAGRDPPPAEPVVRAICRELELELLPAMALAGRMPARVVRYVLAHPRELARLYRLSRPRKKRPSET